MAKIKLYDNAGITELLNLIGDSGYVSLLGMFHHFSLKKDFIILIRSTEPRSEVYKVEETSICIK